VPNLSCCSKGYSEDLRSGENNSNFTRAVYGAIRGPLWEGGSRKARITVWKVATGGGGGKKYT